MIVFIAKQHTLYLQSHKFLTITVLKMFIILTQVLCLLNCLKFSVIFIKLLP